MPRSVSSDLDEKGGVRGLMRAMPPDSRLRKAAAHHQSLADHTRLKILWALSVMDLCPCVLKVITDMSDSKLSYHLKILESERLIRFRRTKNWRIYSITQEGRRSIAPEVEQSP